MQLLHNIKEYYSRRKDLRNDSTREEILLWMRLKNSQTGLKFRRQHSIGGYIVDFYCAEKRLIVELDGAYHNTREQKEYDRIRTVYLKNLNFKVLRFTNNEVGTDTEKVIQKIISS